MHWWGNLFLLSWRVKSMVNPVGQGNTILLLSGGTRSENANVDQLSADLLAAGIIQEGVSSAAVKRVVYGAVVRGKQGNGFSCSVSYLYSELNRFALLAEGVEEADLASALSARGTLQSHPAPGTSMSEGGPDSPNALTAYHISGLSPAAFNQGLGQLTTGISGFDYPTLFNDLLGHLYFSHGCIHMSPMDTSALVLRSQFGLG
jgi:hypothetical protein